ncbi:SWIM zinc finger family protein [Bacillus sp. ISL-47]|uniref:SWIM zinc finger family protein n=1 Tax=Bacillus sp. ISL-47 TaxID=2819130 RepID=UPI001BE66010|nr:DUF6880 family protein [Bacillus sp. ISL-47]MBT2688671.1 SWIM zinc finger family protein [Bacillus sp. ISL-47]MBT2709977.1 SWIM zinc finger family protein [Pseudomonas sp. ISL-84]
MMNLAKFENQMKDVILKRGKDYFNKGRVLEMKKAGENQYIVTIKGTDLYTVTVKLDDNDKIITAGCDCPYDMSLYCKHIGAALFALRDRKSAQKQPKRKAFKAGKSKEPELETILAGLQKEELASIILKISEENPQIKKEIIFKYAPVEDEAAASKKLIREYINSAKRSGFIHWRDVDYALQGANITLGKAKKKLDQGDLQGAIGLNIAILSIVVGIIGYTDDSNGSVGDVIHESLSQIEEAARHAGSKSDEKELNSIFKMILKEAMLKRYDGLEDWRYSLLRACSYFTNRKELRDKLEKQLEQLLDHSNPVPWRAEYHNKEIKLLQFDLIAMNDSEEEIEDFIFQNINYSDFREKAVKLALENREYDKAISLCIEGEKKDHQYPGLISKWKKYLYKTYEMSGDLDSQKELGLQLVYNEGAEYFYKLKKLYSADEWIPVLQEIISKFEKSPYTSMVYEEIMIHEDLNEDLLNYCRTHPSMIEKLYPYLIDEYFEEVNEIYSGYIENSVRNANERRLYKQSCKIIKNYKKIMGDGHAEALITKLKKEYVRRPALLDELNKNK